MRARPARAAAWGGPLTFENTYVARGAVRALMRGCDITHPDERVQTSYLTKYNLMSDKSISANSAMRLDDDIVEAMRKMEQMEDIVRRSSRLRLRKLRKSHLPHLCRGHRARLLQRNGLHPYPQGTAQGHGTEEW